MPQNRSFRRQRPTSKKRITKYDKKNTTIAKARIPRANPYPFGRAFFVTLKCSSQITVAPALHYHNVIAMINSANDPLQGFGNDVYLGHNTFATIYDTYKIFNIRAKVNWISTTAVPTTFALIPGPTNVLAYSVNIQAASASGGISKLTLGSGAVNRVQKLTISRKVRNVIGISKGAYEDDSLYSSDVNNNPTEGAYLSICVISLDETTAVTGTFLIEFEADVLYFNPKKIGQGTSIAV